jgi:hypothetical protein
LTRILNLNSPLSFDLAVVSIEVEIAMFLLNILLSPHFSSVQRMLRPYRRFDQVERTLKKTMLRLNAPDRTLMICSCMIIH